MKNIALITGSSTGIGSGIVKHLSEKGFECIITYNKNKNAGERLLRDVSNSENNHLLQKLDVCSEESVKNMSELIKEKYEKLDLLVCNAGVDYGIEIEKCTFKNWQEATRTKIDGAFLCTQYLTPLLKKSNNANIIYISASLAQKPDPYDPAYSCACAAVENFGKSMAIALSKYRIRTNVVCPGPTKTELDYWKNIEKINGDVWNKLEKGNPLKRITTPQDVAEVIEMLFDDKTNYLNGNVIYVNGGAHIL